MSDNQPRCDDPSTLALDDPIAELEALLQDVLSEVRTSKTYARLFAPDAPASLVLAFMRELFRDVYAYQKRIDEAVFHAVGRFGSSISEQSLVRAMIAVQIEETGHGTLALHDFAALGGDAEAAKSEPPSPGAAAIIGVTRFVAESCHPTAHLGFMFFFERFTTIMVEEVQDVLVRAAYPDERLHFMRLHAEEDVRHADMLADVIRECVALDASARDHIRYGFECFRAVYPMPVWSRAMDRACRSLAPGETRP